MNTKYAWEHYGIIEKESPKISKDITMTNVKAKDN